MHKITIQTDGEGFYDVSDQIKSEIGTTQSGFLTVFCPHTSCALTINEAYDPSASEDMVALLKHLAPRNLKFIKHTMEGPDDSPSHMKAMLLQHSLQLIVENGELVLGRWQGIYLAEFRDTAHERILYLKSISDDA